MRDENETIDDRPTETNKIRKFNGLPREKKTGPYAIMQKSCQHRKNAEQKMLSVDGKANGIHSLLYNDGIIIIFIVLSICMEMQSHQSNRIVIYLKN